MGAGVACAAAWRGPAPGAGAGGVARLGGVTGDFVCGRPSLPLALPAPGPGEAGSSGTGTCPGGGGWKAGGEIWVASLPLEVERLLRGGGGGGGAIAAAVVSAAQIPRGFGGAPASPSWALPRTVSCSGWLASPACSSLMRWSSS